MQRELEKYICKDVTQYIILDYLCETREQNLIIYKELIENSKYAIRRFFYYSRKRNYDDLTVPSERRKEVHHKLYIYHRKQWFEELSFTGYC
jgi:hypothetical protein